MIVSPSKYKTADPKVWIVFGHPWQDRIHPVLAGRIAYLASVKGKKAQCTSGFRSDEEQIQAQKDALAEHKDYVQHADGRVYNKQDQCMVSAIGQSSHNWGLAFDSHNDNDPTWLEKMTDMELRKYGLRKAMSYEPWHIEPVETDGMALDGKKTEFYGYIGGFPMDAKTFQMITGLKPDGVVGPKTIQKMQDVLECIGPELLRTDETRILLSGADKNIRSLAFAGATYGPVRAIAEGLGKTVQWDGKTDTINIK